MASTRSGLECPAQKSLVEPTRAPLQRVEHGEPEIEHRIRLAEKPGVSRDAPEHRAVLVVHFTHYDAATKVALLRGRRAFQQAGALHRWQRRGVEHFSGDPEWLGDLFPNDAIEGLAAGTNQGFASHDVSEVAVDAPELGARLACPSSAASRQDEALRVLTTAAELKSRETALPMATVPRDGTARSPTIPSPPTVPASSGSSSINGRLKSTSPA